MENLTACISINHNWCNSVNLPSLYDSMCAKVTEVEHALEDVKQLRRFARNTDANKSELDRALQVLPIKLEKVGRTAIYGSWFNFFLCSASGSVALPPLISQPITVPLAPVTQPRCKGRRRSVPATRSPSARKPPSATCWP